MRLLASRDVVGRGQLGSEVKENMRGYLHKLPRYLYEISRSEAFCLWRFILDYPEADFTEALAPVAWDTG